MVAREGRQKGVGNVVVGEGLALMLELNDVRRDLRGDQIPGEIIREDEDDVRTTGLAAAALACRGIARAARAKIATVSLGSHVIV